MPHVATHARIRVPDCWIAALLREHCVQVHRQRDGSRGRGVRLHDGFGLLLRDQGLLTGQCEGTVLLRTPILQYCQWCTAGTIGGQVDGATCCYVLSVCCCVAVHSYHPRRSQAEAGSHLSPGQSCFGHAVSVRDCPRRPTPITLRTHPVPAGRQRVRRLRRGMPAAPWASGAPERPPPALPGPHRHLLNAARGLRNHVRAAGGEPLGSGQPARQAPVWWGRWRCRTQRGERWCGQEGGGDDGALA